ncbi:protein of unknown function [Pseudomonas sp. JV551A1]|uniref:Uncharacterized protein n=1 Tax=Pseudomonas inefficax TaxID=2078786 RepID=A0AAQ1P4T0_9PSED|nr:protein of unknown function [Pseudomonas sp. JV551A1]SPO59202.1 protein of unknown function [Pseudomonas inefficax]
MGLLRDITAFEFCAVPVGLLRDITAFEFCAVPVGLLRDITAFEFCAVPVGLLRDITAFEYCAVPVGAALAAKRPVQAIDSFRFHPTIRPSYATPRVGVEWSTLFNDTP